MFIDRNAATIVADRQAIVFVQPHLDPARMARHCFVHRVVEHFGGQMMQRALISAADIHARPAPHRLETFEHLDRRTIVIVAARWRVFKQILCHRS